MTLTLFRPRRGWRHALRAKLEPALSLALALVLLGLVAGLARLVLANPY